ncbi:hypothetical protein BKA61DRAFT_663282 [Leptodontidium sp. MPI-SDFR-AT-0119]|nr:hypothetical protein BKA61DRAFT_663282 [Leptodontidium sp. MPI-SDFR-AT-0119]
MDPLSAIGAVASICQLAHAALSLSKTLYSLGSAIGSASEDVQILAEDLKTFSQSLTLLSRLLEDSKSWYSDDIYLLTAKIIKDCAELYVKIEKILAKLGGNGKSNWKLRVKFVYKEGEIRKLLKRLRDMKGTLATILMSLQVDLQLSLLNLSSSSSLSSSKSRIVSDVSLQPETLQTLKEAQKAVESGGFMTKYTAASEQVIEYSEKGVRISTTHREEVNRQQPAAPYDILPKNSDDQEDTRSKGPDSIQHKSMNAVNVPQCLVMIPSDSADMQNVFAKKNVSRAVVNEEQDPSSEVKSAARQAPPEPVAPSSIDVDMKSVKSSSSVESFKSAKSIQEEELEVARKVKAIQSVLHAFRSALEVLNILVERRIEDRRWDLYTSATQLQGCLVDGRENIDRRNISHFKRHGKDYVTSFSGKHSTEVQRLGSVLMQDVGLKLHEYTAEHEELDNSFFEKLSTSTANVERQVLEYLNIIAESASKTVHTEPFIDYNSHWSTPVPKPIALPTRWQYTRIQPEEVSQAAPVASSDPISPKFAPTTPGYSPTSPSMAQVSVSHPRSPTFNNLSPDGGVIANYYDPDLLSKLTGERVPPPILSPLPPPKKPGSTQYSTPSSDRDVLAQSRKPLERHQVESESSFSLLRKRGRPYLRQSPSVKPQRQLDGSNNQSPLIAQVTRQNNNGSIIPSPPPIRSSTRHQHPNPGDPPLGLANENPGSFDFQGGLDFTDPGANDADNLEDFDFDSFLTGDSGTDFDFESNFPDNKNSGSKMTPAVETPKLSSQDWTIGTRCEACLKSSDVSCDGASTCSTCAKSGQFCIYPSIPFAASPSRMAKPTDAADNSVRFYRSSYGNSQAVWSNPIFMAPFTNNVQNTLGDEIREEGSSRSSGNAPASQHPNLPLLRTPEENWIPIPTYNNNNPWRSSVTKPYTSAFREEEMEIDMPPLKVGAPPPPPRHSANLSQGLHNTWWSSFKGTGGQSRNLKSEDHLMGEGEPDPIGIGSAHAQSLKHGMEAVGEHGLDSDVAHSASGSRKLRRKIGGFQGSSNVPEAQEAVAVESHQKKQRSRREVACFECKRRKRKCIEKKDRPCDHCARQYPPMRCFYEDRNEPSRTPIATSHPSAKHHAKESLACGISSTTENVSLLSNSADETDSGGGTAAPEPAPHHRMAPSPTPPPQVPSFGSTYIHSAHPLTSGQTSVSSPASGVSDPTEQRRQEILAKKEKLQQLRQTREDRVVASAGSSTLSELESAQKAPSRQHRSWESTTDSAMRRSTSQSLRDEVSSPPARPKSMAHISNPIRVQPPSSLTSEQDYQMQLMLLDQGNKKRLMIAQQEWDNHKRVIRDPVRPPSSLTSAIEARNRLTNSALPIREHPQSRETLPGNMPSIRSMLPGQLLQQQQAQAASTRQRQQEQQNKNREEMCKSEKIVDEAVTILLKLDPSRKFKSPVQSAEADKKALADYQMSLMNLNCGHNPKRKMMYRADGTNIGKPAPAHIGTPISQIKAGIVPSSGGHDGGQRASRNDASHPSDVHHHEDRPRSRTRSRTDHGQQREAAIAKAGAATSTVAGLYENRKAKKDHESESTIEGRDERERSRSRSRTKSTLDAPRSEWAKAGVANYNERKKLKEMAHEAERAKELDDFMHGVLRDFDFDSFLNQGESVDNFNFDSAVFFGEDQGLTATPLPAPDPASINLATSPTNVEEQPVFVNSKQFHRILKRRMARQQLDEQMAPSKSYTSGSALPGKDASRGDSSSPRPEESSAEQNVPSDETKITGEPRDPLPAKHVEDDLYSADDIAARAPKHARLLEPKKPNVNTADKQAILWSSGPLLPSPPPAPLNPNPNNNKDIELAWSYPMLSRAQTSRLWWQTYISFIASSSRQSPVFTILSSELQSELGFFPYQYASDEDICKRVVDNVRPIGIAGSTLYEDRPELRDSLILRDDVVQILKTVDRHLDLKTATLGWSCVCVFINIFSKVLNTTASLCPSAISVLETSFSRLQEIVHIIARYAVMENLYQQSITSGTNTTLSLKPEYQSSLLSLCSSILEWFAASYGIGKIVVGVGSGDLAGVGALAILGELDEKMRVCGELMKVVREKNRGCQIFRVEVDVNEEDGGDGESEGVDTDMEDVEDVSDASWEEIGEDDIMSSVGRE